MAPPMIAESSIRLGRLRPSVFGMNNGSNIKKAAMATPNGATNKLLVKYTQKKIEVMTTAAARARLIRKNQLIRFLNFGKCLSPYVKAPS